MKQIRLESSATTDVSTYNLKHSMFARHSVWKCLRRCTFIEVVYTKSASKMTTCEEKIEVQPRIKNFPCQISITITDCTVVTLWQSPSQMKR